MCIRDRSDYSHNILSAPLSIPGLVEGLKRLESLAENDQARAENRKNDGIARDWNATLENVVTQIAARLQAVV